MQGISFKTFHFFFSKERLSLVNESDLKFLNKTSSTSGDQFQFPYTHPNIYPHTHTHSYTHRRSQWMRVIRFAIPSVILESLEERCLRLPACLPGLPASITGSCSFSSSSSSLN